MKAGRRKVTFSFLTIALCLIVAFGFSGCGKSGDGTGGNVVQNVVDAFKDALDLSSTSGDVEGEVGKTYKTQWFAFCVESIEFVDEYAGYQPQEGYTLVDVVVKETNIFDESIPMGTFDFLLDSDSFVEYMTPMAPLNDTMMPEEFELAVDDTVTYHMVYEVPADLADLYIFYTEIGDDGTEEGEIGDTFSIRIK